MKDKNTVTLRYGDDFMSKYFKKEFCHFNNFYHGKGFSLRNIRKIWFKLNFPFKHIWYNKKLLKLKNKKIIIFDSLIIPDFLTWLSHNNNSNRLIFWYHNPVNKSLSIKKIPNNYEIWTYSPNDAKKYNIKLNTQFYFKDIKCNSNPIEFDIFFIGRDKGRLNLLLKYKNDFEELGLKTNFIITKDNRLSKNKHEYSKSIPYEKVLENISKTRAILDLLNNPNDGLTLRVLESIFHKKKLITNSPIIAEYDFYNKKNMFILGKDNLQSLPDFINSEYFEIPDEIVMKYDVQNWIKLFN